MIILENVSKKFGTGEYALTNISFSIEKGEFAFLIGPTGSGKTTIFRMLIKEMEPTQGTIVVSTWNIKKLPGKKIPELRKKVGVVFQDLKLLPDRTVLENVMLPLELAGLKAKDAKRMSEDVLKKVGILEHAGKFPVQLSGGERQRIAIARSLVLKPEILLADEPTGDLDDETAWEIIELLKQINESGTTVLMATHNHDIVKKLNKRIIKLNKGLLVEGEQDVKENKEKDVEKPEAKHETKEKTEAASHSTPHQKQSETKPVEEYAEKVEHHKGEKHPTIKNITEKFELKFRK